MGWNQVLSQSQAHSVPGHTQMGSNAALAPARAAQAPCAGLSRLSGPEKHQERQQESCEHQGQNGGCHVDLLRLVVLQPWTFGPVAP